MKIILSNIKKYGFSGSIYIFYCLIRTKLYFANARLIRFPIDIRNKHLINIEQGFTTGKYCRIEVEALNECKGHKIKIGKNVQINDFVHISAANLITISDNVLIASKVFISDSSHGKYDGFNQDKPSTPPQNRKLYSSPIFIGKNTWIGESVTILKGVSIGNNCIIGANSIVTKDIPDNVIIVGSPARIIKRYNIVNQTWEKI